MSFACLDCCKSFKREYKLHPSEYPNRLECPNCHSTAYNFGRHFKAPKKSNLKQWEKIRFLFQNGFHFQKIYINGDLNNSVSYPETLQEAKEFVNKYKEQAISL